MPVKKISKDRRVTEIIVTIDESMSFLNFTGVKKGERLRRVILIDSELVLDLVSPLSF